jgi:integrase
MTRSIINKFLASKAKGENTTSPIITFTLNLLEWSPVIGFDYELTSKAHPFLRCRIRASGAKSLTVRKRDTHGNLKRVKICTVGEMTLAQATTEYYRIMKEMGEGTIQKRQPVSVTLNEALEAYINDTELAEGTKSNYRRAIRVHLSDWADQPLTKITPELCKKRFQLISERKIKNSYGHPTGGPIAANTVMRVVRALFNFMLEETDGNFPQPPTNKLNPSKGRRKKKSAWNEEKPRDGRIDLTDLPSWWKAVSALGKAYTGNGTLARDYLQFILLTGMRRREATQLEWADITKTQLTVQKTKNGRPLVLPITPAMHEILKRREGEVRPFNIEETRRFMSWVKNRSGVDFTIHDLRRTFAGYAEHYCEVSEKIVGVLLNHSTDQTITSRYTGEIGLRKKAEKLEQIQQFIKGAAGVIDGDTAKVVTIKTKGQNA